MYNFHLFNKYFDLYYVLIEKLKILFEKETFEKDFLIKMSAPTVFLLLTIYL